MIYSISNSDITSHCLQNTLKDSYFPGHSGPLSVHPSVSRCNVYRPWPLGKKRRVLRTVGPTTRTDGNPRRLKSTKECEFKSSSSFLYKGLMWRAASGAEQCDSDEASRARRSGRRQPQVADHAATRPERTVPLFRLHGSRLLSRSES